MLIRLYDTIGMKITYQQQKTKYFFLYQKIIIIITGLSRLTTPDNCLFQWDLLVMFALKRPKRGVLFIPQTQMAIIRMYLQADYEMRHLLLSIREQGSSGELKWAEII